jgi:ligand-binding SRPBCC domain-containing protein
MKLHTLNFTQCLPISLDEAWSFFSTPLNLAEITPSALGFEILSDIPETIYPGLIIQYRIRPVAGIPMRWVTEIAEVEERHLFTDVQRSGPYRLWRHTHEFSTIAGGVRMQDTVRYAPKPSLFGGIINALFVRDQLENIFEYRKRVLENRFGELICPDVS